MHKLTNDRMKWGVMALLAGMLLGGNVLPGARPWSYWAAKNRGKNADLRRAVLVSAPLAKADLFGANLAGADLRGADLSQAYLDGANLAGSDLGGANLTRAIMGAAELQGASLYHTDLRGANLEGADLRGVNLSMVLGLKNAYLEGAHYDELTDWPEDFEPVKHGASLDK